MHVTLSDSAIRIRDGTHRVRDDQGYMIVKDNPIAVAGVFNFLRSQVDARATAANAGEIVKVWRSPESLQRAKDMFCNKPIVHHHKWVGKDGDRSNADGCIGSQVYYKDGALYSDLIIYNPDLIESIESGSCKQLSPGYNAIVSADAGVYNGQQYAFSIEYTGVNHLGVVESGRAGSKLAVMDSIDITGKNMEIKNNASTTTRSIKGTDTSDTSATKVAANSFEQKAKQKQEASKKAFRDEATQRQRRDRTTIEKNNLILTRAGQQLHDGTLRQEDFNFIVETLNRENQQILRRMKALENESKKQKQLADKAAEEAKSAEALQTIHKVLPDFKAYGERRPELLYSRAYQVYTGRKLDDSSEPRTAFIEASKSPRTYTKAKVQDSSVSNTVSEALHKWHLQRQARF